MSLRKTSCQSCVTAKRRCDMGFPSCSRCCKRSTVCHYPYPPPQARDNRSPATQPHINLEISSTDPGSSELHQLDAWLEQSMVVNPGEVFLDPMWLPENTMTAGRVHDSFQGQSGWLNLPTSAADLSSALPRLERRVLEFWPRVDDRQTWGFCFRTFLTYVDHFLDMGAIPLAKPIINRISDLPPLLCDAYGVCAAYKTCKSGKKPFYYQLLSSGVNNANLSSTMYKDLPEQWDHVQALVLFYIIFMASGISDRLLYRQLDCMLAQGTADLERTELASRQSFHDKAQGNSYFYDGHSDDWTLCESARRLIMISYLVRAVHSVVQYRRCDFIKYLAGLPVSIQLYTESCWENAMYEQGQNSTQPTSGVICYDDFVTAWEQGRLSHTDEFMYLLVVACKGLDFVHERASRESILTL